MFKRFVGALLLCSLVVGCGGDDEDMDASVLPDASDRGTVAAFDPPTPGEGGEFGQIPFPSDMYLDDTGHLKITTLPGGPTYDPSHLTVQAMFTALSTMTGAGVWSNVFFPVSGSVDPDTLAGNAKLFDLETGEEVPTDVVWYEDLGLIVAGLKYGTVLREDRAYGAYLTSDVKNAAGDPIKAADDFLKVMDEQTPTDPKLQAAQATLTGLLSTVDAATRAKIVAATAFRTAAFTQKTKAMIDIVRGATLAVRDITVKSTDLEDLFGDDPGPVPGFSFDGNPITPEFRDQKFDHVLAVVQGTLDVPSFVSAIPGTIGVPTYDGEGNPVVQGDEPIKFTMILPKDVPLANMPVVMLVHGVTRSRADLMIYAESFTSRGMALIGFDLIFHGDRVLVPKDVSSWVTGAPVADGFGDGLGVLAPVRFFHLSPQDDYPTFDPRIVTENCRRSAIDISAFVAYLKNGDTGPINTALDAAGLASDLSFQDSTSILGSSFGSLMAGTTMALDADIGAVILAYPPAGFPHPAISHSPAYFLGGAAPSLMKTMLRPFDADERVVPGDTVQDPRWDPIVMIWNWALQEGDSLAFAPYAASGELRGDDGPHIALIEAKDEGYVANSAVEAYSKALGLDFVPFSNQDASPVRWVELAETAAPASGNQNGKTRALTVFLEAEHAFLQWTEDIVYYAPNHPPFVPLEDPFLQQNPTVKGLEMVTRFFRDYYDSIAPRVIDPYLD